ncbi:hypothetical protein F889_03005 [Acinetobacter colistiniresistens]|uniref:Response receiver domain-containing protein n=1 Tax=Acinetobacter colistiniresistens TaxID=280145 RepID=N9PI35_9GAMM|nr:hypothetical protein [Acinetobacter colistiniresistens]ENX33073.1 hypothetical protein F889_03005 [Acinetobacter colistiniresistens]
MKKKILIIDDEINGLRPDMYMIQAESFFKNFEDYRQDETKELFQFISEHSEIFNVKKPKDLSALTPRALFEDYFSKPFFRKNGPTLLTSQLSTIYTIHDSLIKIKSIIESTFSPTIYDFEFIENIPTSSEIKDIDKYELLIVDLKIGNVSSTNFLNSISDIPNLPPIILISSQFNDGKNKLSDYFKETYISATGLTLLSKSDLKDSASGSFKLKLLADQLISQREISNTTKNLIKTWEKLLIDAKSEFSKMLWKLDATIMQQIFNDSISDNVPFSDMINDFLIKELLWNIEESDELKRSIKSLENSFTNHNKKMLAYELDINAHRTLLSHHFYTGGNNIDIDFSSTHLKYPSGRMKRKKDILNNLQKNILTILPFGTILYNSDEESILINITQQCNLAGISRAKQPSLNSLLFIKANISKADNSAYIPYNDKSLVSILHKINSSNVNEFLDIQPNSKHLLSCSLSDFIDLVKKSNSKIIGRMRPEHVISLQQETALTILKPAQTRISRLGACKAIITLIKRDMTSEIFKNNKAGLEIITMESNKYRLSDRLSIDLSVWLKVQLPDLSENPTELLDTIIMPQKINAPQNLGSLNILFLDSKSQLPNGSKKKHTLVIQVVS